MERYQTKQIAIRRSAAEMWAYLADPRNATPLLGTRTEEWDWKADQESCSLRVAGFPIAIRRGESDPGRLLRYVPDGGPFNFTLSGTFTDTAPGECRLEVVFEIELNPIMKMMLDGRIREGMRRLEEFIEQAGG